jgi:hypothetical protein
MDRLPCDVAHRIKLSACLMEMRDMFSVNNEKDLAVWSLWRVLAYRIGDLSSAKLRPESQWLVGNLLGYMRSKLGLAQGCGPMLEKYRSVMDYLDEVAWGTVEYTAENLIDSANDSNTADILKIAEVANRFYPGATWHICDAGYTSSEEEQDVEVAPLEIRAC